MEYFKRHHVFLIQCVSMFMCMCACVWEGAHTCLCMHVEARGQHQVSSSINLYLILKNYFYAVCVCTHVCVYLCVCVFISTMTYMEKPEDNLLESLLSCHVAPRDWTRVIRFGSKHLYPMSHLTCPLPIFWDRVSHWTWSSPNWLDWLASKSKGSSLCWSIQACLVS